MVEPALLKRLFYVGLWKAEIDNLGDEVPCCGIIWQRSGTFRLACLRRICKYWRTVDHLRS